MKAEFDVKLSAEDLYGFNMYQTYTSIHGFISILMTAVFWITAGFSFQQGNIGYGFLYIAAGILFLVYMPLTLWFRSKKTIETNSILSGVLHYEVSEDAIKVTQGEEMGELPWNLVYKVVVNSKRILIYSNRINAYVIPRTQIGAQYDAFVEVASQKLDKYRVKIKK